MFDSLCRCLPEADQLPSWEGFGARWNPKVCTRVISPMYIYKFTFRACLWCYYLSRTVERKIIMSRRPAVPRSYYKKPWSCFSLPFPKRESLSFAIFNWSIVVEWRQRCRTYLFRYFIAAQYSLVFQWYMFLKWHFKQVLLSMTVAEHIAVKLTPKEWSETLVWQCGFIV